MKTLRIRMNEVHNNAKAHGWWDDCTTLEERRAKIPEKILLVHYQLLRKTILQLIDKFHNYVLFHIGDK